MQRLRQQRVRAEVLGDHDLPARRGNGPVQGGVGLGLRAGQQRHDHGERGVRPLRGGGQRIVQAVVAAFQVGHLKVGPRAGLPGGLGELAADPVAGRAGAARHGEQQSRRVRRQAQPVRAAMAARATGAIDTAGQYRLVGGRVPALGQGLCALGQGLCALREGFCALGQGFSALGQRVSALREGFAALGQGFSALGQGFAALGQGFSALGQRVSALRERFSALREGFSALREGFPALRQGIASPGQRLSALRQRLSALRQRFPALAWVSHAAVSYSGFIRHDRRSLMFGPRDGRSGGRSGPFTAVMYRPSGGSYFIVGSSVHSRWTGDTPDGR